MFVLSSKRLLITFFVIMCSTLLLLVLAINFRELKSTEFSIDSQNTLYWGIIIIILQLFTFLNLYRSHKKIIYNIRKISKIGELSHPIVKQILNGMGSLGSEIDVLLRTQNELIELRANRITALNNLISRLSFDYKYPMLITDVSGKILNYSNLIRDKIVIDSMNITDIILELPLESIIHSMESSKSIWQDDNFKGVSASPIFDRKNKVSYCLWELDDEIKKINKSTEILKVKKKSFKNFIGRFSKKNS